VKAIALAYHDVFEHKLPDDGGIRQHPGRYALSRDSFRSHLSSIPPLFRGSRVDILAGLREWGCEIPIFLTFDDGALGAYTCIADELEKRSWRGHFFVVSSWIGRRGFMNHRQIRELRRRGHVIGSHSHSHPERMANLGSKQLSLEWTESCSILSELLGEKVTVASVPNGYYSSAVGAAAASAGVEVLFNSEPASKTRMIDGCLVIGRYSVMAGDPSDLSGSLVSNRLSRSRQRLLWDAKKTVKVLAGPAYLAIRTMWLSRFDKPKPDLASTGE